MKRIVIIGATGAIGTALLDVCVHHHTEAYVLVRADSKRMDRIPKSPLIHTILCGMEEMSQLDVSNIPPIDTFYYFAWAGTHGTNIRNNTDLQVANIQYTLDAVHLAKRMGAKVFVGAGTQAEYGRVEGILWPDTPCNPENGYGIAKLCAGQMSKIECHQYGMKHIWGRILSTYGPRDGDHSMVSCAIRDCLKGINPQFTEAEQVWDYLYSGDAGEAFYLMGKSGKDGVVYVVGSGSTRKLKDYIKVMCETANPDVTPVLGARPYMDKQVMHLQADISALTKDTGFLPKVGFEEGITKTIDWLKGVDR